MNPGRAHTTNRWARRAAWLFPIVVWALATMLLKGDLGRWNDDYAFNQRVPETGAIPRLHPDMGGLLTLSQQFWRPLFFIIIPTLQTALWNTPWANHALHAVLHLGLCALVWRLFLALGLSRWTAASLTLVYMTFPVHFQTLFWSACLTTVVATGIYVVLILMYLRYAELPPMSAGSWLRIAGWTAGMVLVGTLIPLINEQPAAAVIALPFLHPALRVSRDPARGPWLRDVMRALLPIAALLAVYAGYLYIYVRTSTRGDYPATAGTFINLRPSVFFSRMPSFLAEMWECMTIQGHWDELFKDGVRTLKGMKLEGAAWIVATVGTGAAWAWWWFRGGSSVDPPDAEAPARRGPGAGQIVAFGVMVFASAWGVIYILKVYSPAPRLYFMPLIGVAAIVGTAADAAWAWARRSGPWTDAAARLVGAAIVPVVIAGAMILAGAQSMYRRSFYRDEEYARQLRELVPSPPKDAFFALVRVEDPAYFLGEAWYTRQFHQIFLSSFNVNAWIKQQMRRSDVTCGTYTHDRYEYKIVDESTLGWQWWFVPPGTPIIPGEPYGCWGVSLIPWDKVVPFKIDAQGKLRLVTEVAIQRANNADGSVRPAMVAQIAQDHPAPEEVATFYNTSADRRVVSLAPWKFASGAVVTFARPFDWDIVYTLTRLRSESATVQGRSRMFAVLPPSDRSVRVHFRAGISREDTAKGVPAVEVRWTVGDGASPAAALTLTPELMRDRQRWLPVTFEVPPHRSPLPIEVSVASAGDGSSVYISEGYMEVVDPPDAPPAGASR